MISVKHHEIVRTSRNDKPAAEIVPINKLINPLQQHDELKNIRMHFDPTEPLIDDEWPSELR